MQGIHPATIDFAALDHIMIMGTSGSGKSTLARQLGELLGIEAIHLDALFWMPGWQQRPEDDFQMLVRKAAEKERWIIDGNYRRTIEPRLAVADLLIFLDPPRHVYMRSIVKRQLRTYGRTRPDLGAECPERFDPKFLKWAWDFHPKRRPEMIEEITALQSQLPVIWLESRREVHALLETVQANLARNAMSAA